MEITARSEEEFAVIRVKGKVVRENQADLRKALEEAVAGGRKGIALDFGEVDYIDSSGLGSCAAVQKVMQDRKCGALVVFGASPNIERMWKLIRLDLVIPLTKNEKEALARLRAGSRVGV